MLFRSCPFSIELKVLLSMLKGQTDPYVTWLSNLERQLRLTSTQTKKKK